MATPTPEELAAGVPAGVNIVDRVPAPSGKGFLLLDESGGVYDTGGQSFSGSYFSLRPEDRQGTRKFTGLKVDDKTGGYQLQSDQPGQNYDFGPSEFVKNMPKANPLYSDPAFLAYLASSGRDYETAAGIVQRKKAALEGALTLDKADIMNQGKKDLESIYGNFASRGLYGAGQQAVKEDEAQASTLSQIAKKEGQTASDIEGLVGGLAQKRSEIMSDATAKGYDVAGQQDLDKRLGDVDRKYPEFTEIGKVK